MLWNPFRTGYHRLVLRAVLSSSRDAGTPCFESATFHSSSVLSHGSEGIYQHVLQAAQLSELPPLKPGFAVAVNDAGHR